MTLWSFSKSMKADDVKKKSTNEKEDLTYEKKKPKSFSKSEKDEALEEIVKRTFG